MYSCNKDEVELLRECDASYVWEFEVKNETDKAVVITDEYPYGPYPHNVTLASGKSEIITSHFTIGPCDAKIVMEELYKYDFHIGVGGIAGVGDNIFGYPFTMTIDGVKIYDDIWLRKHWSFMPELYRSTYTLIITDELLASLPSLAAEE